MQAVSLPPQAGWHWIRAGWRLFRLQPLAMFLWSLFISMVGLFAMIVAPIGPIIFVALMPIITLMTMSACKHVEAGRMMLPSMWSRPLTYPGVARRLFSMGCLYAGISTLAGLLAFLPFADTLTQGLTAAQDTYDLGPLLTAFRAPLILFLVLYVIIAALFWYVPPLIAWGEVRPKQALFFSAVACWRNRWAFLVYALCWAAIFLGLDLITSWLVDPLGLSATIVGIVAIPVNVVTIATLYCSFYPSYTSVFVVDEPRA